MPVRVDENSHANATIQVIRKKIVVRMRPIRETEIASASISRTNTYGRSSTVLPKMVRNSISGQNA
jgi:ribosomal protein S19